jgi:hypothetical protein
LDKEIKGLEDRLSDLEFDISAIQQYTRGLLKKKNTN